MTLSLNTVFSIFLNDISKHCVQQFPSPKSKLGKDAKKSATGNKKKLMSVLRAILVNDIVIKHCVQKI